jgi:hypothetical protein
MADVFKTFLNLGIRAGLSDRDAFVKEVSSKIESYNDDPEKAHKWASGLAQYMESLQEDITMQSAIKGAMSDLSLPTAKKIDKLAEAIEDLTKELKKDREKK